MSAVPDGTTAFTRWAGCKERHVGKYRDAGPVKCNVMVRPLQGIASFPSRWNDDFDAGTVDRSAVVVRGALSQQEAHVRLDDSLEGFFPIRDHLNRLAQIKLLRVHQDRVSCHIASLDVDAIPLGTRFDSARRLFAFENRLARRLLGGNRELAKFVSAPQFAR